MTSAASKRHRPCACARVEDACRRWAEIVARYAAALAQAVPVVVPHLQLAHHLCASASPWQVLLLLLRLAAAGPAVVLVPRVVGHHHGRRLPSSCLQPTWVTVLQLQVWLRLLYLRRVHGV